MNNVIVLKRDSTNITISEFFERYNLGKYNFEPRYQRRGDVWDVEKQSFLIDSILKNYPIPPIFLHQRIDEATGTTKYDIIDGKQRLTAIIRFLNNEIPLPQDFEEGPFGDKRLNGLYFNELDDELADFKKQLWRYIISIEYIDSEDLEIIDNVFDRLNRNGEPLGLQELRKAKYHDTPLMNTVIELSQYLDWSNLEKIKFNRMQDQEFVSELIFFILEGQANDASLKENLDSCYEKWSRNFIGEKVSEVSGAFKDTIQFINDLHLDFDEYKIKGVSHFYALFALAYHCVQKKINPTTISDNLKDFYKSLRDNDCTIQLIQEYRSSMQSNTKSKSQRQKRISALETYCFESSPTSL